MVGIGRKSANNPRYYNGLLGIEVGKERKVLLVHFSRNTKKTYTDHINELIDLDVKQHPDKYVKPVDIKEELSSIRGTEEKIIFLMKYYKRLMSLRFITSALYKFDKPTERASLRIVVSLALKSQKFYNTKRGKKHLVYGLSSWIDNMTTI